MDEDSAQQEQANMEQYSSEHNEHNQDQGNLGYEAPLPPYLAHQNKQRKYGQYGYDTPSDETNARQE